MQNLLLSNTNQTAIGVTTRPGPSLDLNFAASLNTVDQVSGQNPVTFNRTTSGTYFDSAGVLRSAAVNLLLRSEEFDNSAIWGVLNVTVSANTQVAPNGVTSADTITDVNGVTTANVGCFQGTTLADSTTYAMSCYVKAGTKTTCRVGIRDKSGANIFANFNLTTASTTVGNAVSSTIQDAGNGWYRCTAICASSTGATSQRGLVYMDTGSYAADGTGTIHVWGAQLEQSATVGEYIPTTSVINSAPRFDHNPTTGESLGLLVEEQRTNLLLRSEEFDNAYWTKSGATVSADQTASPIGTVTADKLIESAANSEHWAGRLSLGLPSAIYTCSIYAKAAERTSLSIFIDTSVTRRTQYFNLSTGALGSSSGGITSSMQSVGNGWYRCSITLNAAEGLSNAVYTSAIGNSNSYTGDGTSGLFFWGAQLEAGAFPTSYIPTTTAAATRSADVASITGSAFSAWYNASEGTWFSAFSIPTSSTTGGARVYSISNSGATTQTWLRLQGGTSRVYEVTDSSTQQAVLSAGTFSAGVRYRGAVALKSNDFGFSENGSTPTVDNSGTLGTVDRMGIGMDASGTAPLNGHIRRLTYYPVRIPNALLQAITL